MGIKRILGCVVIAIILFACTLTYTKEDKRLRIINDTNVDISELKLIDGEGNLLETLSVLAGEREFVNLPKSNKIDFIYYYDNNQSSESFEIRNKELDIENLDIIIRSIDQNGKLMVDVS